MAAPCSKLGRLGRGIAPKCFVPDVNAVKKHGMQLAGALELITRNLNTPQLQVLGSILMTTGSLRKANLSPFQRVYFPIGNKQYLSNWYSGTVIGMGSGDDRVVVLGASPRGSTQPIVAQLFQDSLVQETTWQTMRDKMIASGKIVDPESSSRRTKIKHPTSYTPPMLDVDPEELEARAKDTKKKRRTPVKANSDVFLRIE